MTLVVRTESRPFAHCQVSDRMSQEGQEEVRLSIDRLLLRSSLSSERFFYVSAPLLLLLSRGKESDAVGACSIKLLQNVSQQAGSMLQTKQDSAKGAPFNQALLGFRRLF